MHCPFSGYPIEIIRWEKARQELVSSKYANQIGLARLTVAHSGQSDRTDNAEYTNPNSIFFLYHGQSARSWFAAVRLKV